jgi:NADPH2:quinone reductase
MATCIHVESLGGPEVMSIAEAPAASPGPGQAAVAVSAAGVNFIDVYFRTGVYPRPLPFVPGLEGAGRVVAVGEGVTDLAAGDRVAWAAAPGSYATEIVAPTASLVPVPDDVADDVAAASMLQGMTAHYLVNATRETRPGDTALVHAAAGGVGLILIQMLVAAGARVMGTCSTDEKAKLARAAGAQEIVRYDQEDFAPRARDWTDGRGVDVVYDSVGQSTFEGSLSSLRPRGLLCLFGQSSGVVPPFDLGRLNGAGSLFVTRPSLAHYVATREELLMRANDVLGAVSKGELDIRIGARFALSEAAEAHRALEGRRTTGKVLLIP